MKAEDFVSASPAADTRIWLRVAGLFWTVSKCLSAAAMIGSYAVAYALGAWGPAAAVRVLVGTAALAGAAIWSASMAARAGARAAGP